MTDFSRVPTGVAVGATRTGSPVQPVALVGPRHLVWPLRLGPDGTFASLEQDSIEEVTQCVQVLLSTRVGERYMDAPSYGLEEPITGDPIASTLAQGAIEAFEPRAAVGFEVTPLNRAGGQTVRVTVAIADDIDDRTS